MAILTVTTNADVVDAGDGRLSLREAVAQANATAAADTIRFAGALEGASVVLTGGELFVSRDLAIEGDTDGDGLGVTIDGDGASRLLNIQGFVAGNDVRLSGLTLTGGAVAAEDGGAIRFTGASLTVEDCAIVGNAAGVRGNAYYNDGGAIWASGGRIAIVDSDISGNYASGGAAGIDGSGTILTVRGSRFADNDGVVGGAIGLSNGVLSLEDSQIIGNDGFKYSGSGGGLWLASSEAWIERCSINGNGANYSGGISINGGRVTIADSTIADNVSANDGAGFGGGIGISGSGSQLVLRNSTVTGNQAVGAAYIGYGGGIAIGRNSGAIVEMANSIVAGNLAEVYSGSGGGQDIYGTVARSNGRNVFGTDVAGNNPGDREGIAASLIFATIDPQSGGGVPNASGIVPLRNSIDNPALSGADPLAASATGQLGTTGRPLPAGSLPDIGSIEITQALSTGATANNDVRTGTGGANTLNGLGGNDLLRGLGGNDTLNGGDGSDLLDGGAGNDRLNGDGAIDLVFYGGSTKVTVDLSLATDTAKRGSETDTLTNVEGAVGSSAGDVFKGNQFDNHFQGGLGRDTFSGGSGRDLYDLNAVAESRPGAANRDVVTDFDHLVDDLDLMGIDADTTVAGNQAFRWVGTSALTGAGQVGYFTSGGDTIVRASVDADATAELQVQLSGIKPLTVDDFYL